MAVDLRRHRLAVWLVAMISTTALAAPSPAWSSPQPADDAAANGAPVAAEARNKNVRIKIQPKPYRTSDGVQVGKIPRAIVGANQRWPDDGKGVWDSAAGQPAPNVVKLSKQAGLDMLRYPGGTVANTFDFTQAIGPLEERGCQTSGGFANGQFAATDSRFGPDENEKMARAIGGETMVMVSHATQSASYAADYVEYMNSPADGAKSNPNGGTDWAEVRAANGQPRPYGTHYWEFDNEPYLGDQRYWRSPDTGKRLQQFIHGGWQRQTAQGPTYQNNDGLFLGCDLAKRQKGTGEPNQNYRVRFGPIALPGDEIGESGVGDGPVTAPILRVDGEQWTRVDSFDDQASDAQVYTIHQKQGTVQFGDGTHGAAPPADASLSMEYTSGIHDGFLDFQRAMKAVDPSIEVCSGWGNTDFVQAMGSTRYDCLGVHSYTVPAADGTITRYDGLQTGAADRDAQLRNLRNRLATWFPAKSRRPDLLVTEYGTLVFGQQYEARLAHNLYSAAQLAGQLESDVKVSINSNTADLPKDGSTDSAANVLGSAPFFTTGRALMLRQFAEMAGGTVVRSGVVGNPSLGSGTNRYGALRVVTSCTADKLQTVVVNRDAESVVKAELSLPLPIRDRVKVSTVNGASVESFNTPEHPDDVRLTRSIARVDDGVLEYSFEPHSVTRLEYGTRGRAC